MKNQYSKLMLSKLNRALEGSPAKEITKDLLTKGGPGSGHHGHAGRPGEIGGSVSGGVAVGRAESPEADTHFKFSGDASLKRAFGPNVELAMSHGKGGKNFEVVGAVDKKGNLVRGKCALRVGGETLEIDNDELHALRSKVRYMQMLNDRDVRYIAGREAARGNSLNVSVGGKTVSIPINEKTVEDFNEAAKMARAEGLSFTGESKREVKDAVKAMAGRSPVSVVKERGFSKGGQYAAFMAHANKLSEPKMRASVEKIKDTKKRKMMESTVNSILRNRKDGHTARKAMSGTQSVKAYKKAAAFMTIFMRRM